MIMEHLEKAIQYVRENKDWSEAEEQVALDQISKMRCPLNMTSTGSHICDKIRDLMDEYGEDNDLAEGWWDEDAEAIFWKL